MGAPKKKKFSRCQRVKQPFSRQTDERYFYFFQTYMRRPRFSSIIWQKYHSLDSLASRAMHTSRRRETRGASLPPREETRKVHDGDVGGLAFRGRGMGLGWVGGEKLTLATYSL